MELAETMLAKISDSLPFHVFWLNEHAKFQFVNTLHQENFGINLQQSIGKSIPEFGKLIKLDRALETKIIDTVNFSAKSHKTSLITSIPIDLTHNRRHIFSSWYLPIIKNQKFLGIFGFAIDLTTLPKEQLPFENGFLSEKNSSEVVEFLWKLAKDITPDYPIAKSQSNVKLSHQEKICIALVMKGMTSNDIATMKQLSKRTVESYLNNAKNKLSCKNMPELIYKCMKHNLIDDNLIEI